MAHRTSPEMRTKLLAKITINDHGCWIWTAGKSEGYGRVYYSGRTRATAAWTYAHRLSYELFVGPIGDGLEIDHLCRVRACVNPDHLEAVDKNVNIARGESPPARNARKTHCIHGHEFNTANTYIRPDGGGRMCRTCLRNRANARKNSALSSRPRN